MDWYSLQLSFLAGLATTLGGMVVFLFKSAPSKPQMAFVLSVAAGVMISVSVIELWYPSFSGASFDTALIRIFWSMVGGAAYLALSRLIPREEELHSAIFGDEMMLIQDKHSGDEMERELGQDSAKPSHQLWAARQWRLAVLMMIILTAHNLPEGVAVAMSTLNSHHSGVIVAFAIALHNIPEGIAISVPAFAATGRRFDAIKWSLLSGLSEPVGALLGLCFLQPFLTEDRLANVLCVVAGMMTAVSFTELLPAALDGWHLTSVMGGLACGVLVMCLTSLYA